MLNKNSMEETNKPKLKQSLFSDLFLYLLVGSFDLSSIKIKCQNIRYLLKFKCFYSVYHVESFVVNM